MLASLVQTLSTAFGDMLEWALNAFMEALTISNLSSYLDIFPLLSTFYTYLRSFSVAMTAIIAGKALATFAMGSIDSGNAKDNPGMVLVKTFFAVGGIYWGGYVLDYIVHLGSIPYDQFMNVNAVSLGTTRINLIGAVLEGLAGLAGAWATGLALGLLELFVLAIIAWNLFKLVLEVCERWLMVGILVYTSPLVYCTIPSNETSQIFKRWVSMFVGSVMQMSLSVMFLKLILSGFNGTSQTPFFLKMLMILAMCKIAQRMDSYLQQLGVGVATTGGNMLDDVIASAHALSRFGRGGKSSSEGGSRQGILGSAFSRSNLGAGFSAAKRAWNSNASLRDTLRAGANAATDNMMNKSFAGRAVKGTQDLVTRKRAAANAAGAAGKAAGKPSGAKTASGTKATGTAAAAGAGAAAQKTGTKPAGTGGQKPAGSEAGAAAGSARTEAPKTQARATADKTSGPQAGQAEKVETGNAAATEAAAAAAGPLNQNDAAVQKEDAAAKAPENKEPGAPEVNAMAVGAAGPVEAAKPADAADSEEQKTDADKQADVEAAKESAAEKAGLADVPPATDSVGNGNNEAASSGDAAATANQAKASADQSDAADVEKGAQASAGDQDSHAAPEEIAGAAAAGAAAGPSASTQGSSAEEYSGRAVSGQHETESSVGNDAAEEAKEAGQEKANESGSQVAAFTSSADAGGGSATDSGPDVSSGAGPESGPGTRIDTPPAQKCDPSDPTQEPQNFGQVLRKAFHDSHAYAFGRGQGMVYSAADYKNAEQTAVANQDAVADRNNEFATGHEAMPQSVRENAEQIISGNTGARRPNAADAQTSFRTSGATNSSGNVLESAPEGDLRLTPQAAAAGAEIGEVKNADGSTSRVLQDRGVAGMVAGAYMASAIDQGAVTGTGERSYSALEGKSAYVQQRMESDSYYAQAGREEADEQRQTDRSTMSSFEGSIPATKSAREAADVARNSVDTLRNSGAAPEIVRKAEADYQTASANLYQAAVAIGSQRVEEARQRMADYDRQGMSHNAPEYQAAARSYKEHSDNLAKYQEAYGRASTPGYYDGLATSKANELRQDEANSHAATYDQVQKDAVSMLNNTIQNASPIALSKALLDPNYHPADCAETRAIADRLFGELLQDRKAGSQIQSVVVSDHSANATIGGQELAGGRSIAVTYTKQDGSTATATFMDAVGTTALPDGLREKMKVCKTGDGRDWLAEGVSSNMSARPSGTQVRRSSTVSKVFSLLRKITKS